MCACIRVCARACARAHMDLSISEWERGRRAFALPSLGDRGSETKSDEHGTQTRTILREECDFLPAESVYDPSDGLTAATGRSQDSGATSRLGFSFHSPVLSFLGSLYQ